MATELGVKNLALEYLGEPALSTTTDDVESRYLLDNTWLSAIAFVLRQAPWRFAMETSSITGATSNLIPGYDYSFDKPADWMRTHAIFILSDARECPLDVKEEAGRWHANISPIVVRFVSSEYDDPEDWTEHFAKALAAYLAFSICEGLTGDTDRTAAMSALFKDMLAAAMQHDAIPESPWLVHQHDGSFLSTVLSLMEEGMWRFAIRTVEVEDNGETPASGYGYAFTRPSDWIRTVWMNRTIGTFQRDDIDFWEEDGLFHANYTPVVLRYLSKDLALDSRNWSVAFSEAVLARLNLRAGAGRSGAEMQALAVIADTALREARMRDDARERPRVDRISRLEAARFAGSSFAREQGWGPRW